MQSSISLNFRLFSTMTQLRATPTQAHPDQTCFVHKDLASCTHVFIREDAVRKQPIIDRTVLQEDKFFIVNINGQKDTVAIDRLKPAYLVDMSSCNSVEAQLLQTRYS